MRPSDTILLMRIIGLPNSKADASKNVSEATLIRLLPFAIRNKVSLLFLERALEVCKDSEYLENMHRAFTKRSQRALNLISETYEALAQKGTNHVIFKTFKPFPFFTVDVDVLFFTLKDLIQAHHTLLGQGCTVAGYGPYTITLYSPKHNMNIDLHLEVAVSRMVYINKQLLKRYVTETKVGSVQALVLEPPAELAMVIAHSLYKEQMVTLCDYYATIIQLSNMNTHQRTILVNLAEQLHVGLSLKLMLNVLQTLTIQAFGTEAPVITETARLIQLGEINEETIKVTVGHFMRNVELPHKYHPVSVALAITMKFLKDPKMRGTIPQQFLEMISNRTKFFKDLLLHLRRDAY